MGFWLDPPSPPVKKVNLPFRPRHLKSGVEGQERVAMTRKNPRSHSTAGRYPAGLERRGEFEAQALPHLRSLYSLAYRLTRNEKDAEDLVQDTYLRAFRFYHRFEPGTNIRAWLYRILKNQFLNRLQEERPFTGLSALTDPADSHAALESAFPHSPARTPEQEVLDTVTAGEVEEALALLPADYRLVVTLALSEEMSYKEIAKILGIPIGTVMSRLHRGRKFLQSKLHDYVAHRHLVGKEALSASAQSRSRAVTH
jgi:RNA polymerase sigma-70 factor (ECF subfamily)